MLNKNLNLLFNGYFNSIKVIKNNSKNHDKMRHMTVVPTSYMYVLS